MLPVIDKVNTSIVPVSRLESVRNLIKKAAPAFGLTVGPITSVYPRQYPNLNSIASRVKQLELTRKGHPNNNRGLDLKNIAAQVGVKLN